MSDDIIYIEKMRGRLGLDSNDKSMDEHISELSPFERVKLIAGWEIGYDEWADIFKEWLESQGIFLTTNCDCDEIIE